MLVRVVKRKTSLESLDVDQWCEYEFPDRKRGGVDLTPSVYETAETHLVQVHAEHSAGAQLDPPRGRAHLDLAGFGRRVARVPGPGPFGFTREAHRELRLSSEKDLRRLIEEIFARLGSCKGEVSGDAIIGYARGRIAAHDAEWLRFCEQSPKARKWGCPPAASPASEPS